MQVKFLPAAKSRLLEVWEYSESTWGESQADSYLRGLVDSIQQAAKLRHRRHTIAENTRREDNPQEGHGDHEGEIGIINLP